MNRCCKETKFKLIHDVASWLRPSDPSAARALELNFIPKSERGAYRGFRQKTNEKKRLPAGMRWRGGIIYAMYTDSLGKRFERSTGTELPFKAKLVVDRWRNGEAIPLPLDDDLSSF